MTSASAPTGLRPPAQGCRFGYPGQLRRRMIINRKAVGSFALEKSGATALRLNDLTAFFPG